MSVSRNVQYLSDDYLLTFDQICLVLKLRAMLLCKLYSCLLERHQNSTGFQENIIKKKNNAGEDKAQQLFLHQRSDHRCDEQMMRFIAPQSRRKEDMEEEKSTSSPSFPLPFPGREAE